VLRTRVEFNLVQDVDFCQGEEKKTPPALCQWGLRKEELTKRLCSLVYNSQDSCKKVPSGKKAPTYQGQPMGAEGRGMRRDGRDRKSGETRKRVRHGEWVEGAGSRVKRKGVVLFLLH
jgi:hypothetical protein